MRERQTMIDPLSVYVAIPALDGRQDCLNGGGLAACAAAHLFGTHRYQLLCSDIRRARNLQAARFLEAESFDWLFFLDSDIGFSEADFRTLMDYPKYHNAPYLPERNPEGTTLTDDGHALIVCAEYSKKTELLEPARFGLGFCRIHRSVFQRLLDARDDGIADIPRSALEETLRSQRELPDYEELIRQLQSLLARRDPAPRIGSFIDGGQVYHDFFPNGPGMDGHWFGEDTGFFHLCRLCGITPRIERRTSLLHVGRKVYPYANRDLSLDQSLETI